MRKLDLILENIRDEYMINLLEEGTSSELETLKTKKFLNENLNRIRKMLIEEGALEGVKQHLGNNWGKYLAGAGAAGLGGLAANSEYGTDAMQQAQGALGLDGDVQAGAQSPVGEVKQIGDKVIDAAGNIFDQAGQIIGNLKDQAGAALQTGRNEIEAMAGMDDDVRAGAQFPTQRFQPPGA